MDTNTLQHIDTVFNNAAEHSQAVAKEIEPLSVFWGGLVLVLVFVLMYMGGIKLFAIIEKQRRKNMPMKEDENEDIT